MMYHFIALLCGIIFGVGLTISEMINPNKVLNFLDITGTWDPSLLFVMVGAVLVTLIGYRLVRRLPHPQCDVTFHLPKKTSFLDARLIIGAAIFGIGWGLAGYCPGPAITALGLGIMDAVYVVIGMIISALLFLFLPQNIKK